MTRFLPFGDDGGERILCRAGGGRKAAWGTLHHIGAAVSPRRLRAPPQALVRRDDLGVFGPVVGEL
jgi:hypothetical protein